MREIAITDIAGAAWGHASDEQGGTGCTVVLTEQGAAAGLDIRGGGPASRETALLEPTAAAAAIHGVLLSGGSAFGLGAADGVLRFLAERSIGVDVGVARVPLVVQADIFDLDFKSADTRPDAVMAEAACRDAVERVAAGSPLPQGSVGVGTGATVGKALGPKQATKSGVGHYAVQLGEIQLGALAVCNAIGDVFDIETGARLAGLRDENGAPLSSEQVLYQMLAGVAVDRGAGEDAPARTTEASPAEPPVAHTNTTLGIVVTNVALDKTALTKLAQMAQNGLARTIRPVHTSFDGDAVFALSVGTLEAPAMALDALGTLAAFVLGKAINNAVRIA